jgi:hypothetical protein
VEVGTWNLANWFDLGDGTTTSASKSLSLTA